MWISPHYRKITVDQRFETISFSFDEAFGLLIREIETIRRNFMMKNDSSTNSSVTAIDGTKSETSANGTKNSGDRKSNRFVVPLSRDGSISM